MGSCSCVLTAAAADVVATAAACGVLGGEGASPIPEKRECACSAGAESRS